MPTTAYGAEQMGSTQLYDWLKVNSWECFHFDGRRVARREWKMTPDASVVVTVVELKTRVQVTAYQKFKGKTTNTRKISSTYKTQIGVPDFEGVPRGLGLVSYLKQAGLDPRKEQSNAAVS